MKNSDSHFLMSIYQVIFGVPNSFWGSKTCLTIWGRWYSYYYSGSPPPVGGTLFHYSQLPVFDTDCWAVETAPWSRSPCGICLPVQWYFWYLFIYLFISTYKYKRHSRAICQCSGALLGRSHPRRPLLHHSGLGPSQASTPSPPRSSHTHTSPPSNRTSRFSPLQSPP